MLPEWLAQSFLGTKSTYGDDRSLTNHVLKYRWKVLYAPDARAKTVVPETMKQFLRQQLRWKKSWIRESLAASRFMWKGHPINAALFYSSIILTSYGPTCDSARGLRSEPFVLGVPYYYVIGVVAMSMVYALYYRMYRPDPLWKYGVLFAFFYTAVLVWQLPIAIASLSDTRWGTRAC